MKIQYNKFYIKKKKIYCVSVRTIRLSSNYIYFIYYYTDVCDLTLICCLLICYFALKHRFMSLSSTQLKLSEKVYKNNYAIDHNQ